MRNKNSCNNNNNNNNSSSNNNNNRCSINTCNSSKYHQQRGRITSPPIPSSCASINGFPKPHHFMPPPSNQGN
eukprot:4484836-Prorocentrum_lima.AAC.1